jgi:hypothetical protein
MRRIGLRQVYFDQGVQGYLKEIANDQELVQIGFANAILPVADRRLSLLDQRGNLTLGFRQLLA